MPLLTNNGVPSQRRVFNSLLCLFFLALVIVCFIVFQKMLNQRNHAHLLTECTGHREGNLHIHATLTITQDGRPIEIPANIGLVGDCIHPIHTHDATGLIHLDYPQPILFTLGDLFDTMGIVLTDDQIGSIKTTDGYKITVTVNGKTTMKDFRAVPFLENAKMYISITSSNTLHP